MKKIFLIIILLFLCSCNKKETNCFIESKYYNESNLTRYEKYYKYTNYSCIDTVKYVELDLDKGFYNNMNYINEINELTLINKNNKLIDNIEIDLINLPNSNLKVNKIIYNSLLTLIDTASKEGLSLSVISAYRTKDYQNNLFNNSVKKNGLDHALKYSARARHSEHETGLAVDFNSVMEDFKYTEEYKWLKENAYKYGFIERYQLGKEHITGYAYEPWHYRYVGINNSTIIYKENITLEEYVLLYK